MNIFRLRRILNKNMFCFIYERFHEEIKEKRKNIKKNNVN